MTSFVRRTRNASPAHLASFASKATSHPVLIRREVAGHPRPRPPIPAKAEWRGLLLPPSPAYSRSARKRQDRPVTPEVAGFESRRSRKSSYQSGHCVVGSEADWAPTTHTFLSTRAERGKSNGGTQVQADSRGVQAANEGGMRLHETTGGQAGHPDGRAPLAVSPLWRKDRFARAPGRRDAP